MNTFPRSWRSTFVFGSLASAFLFALHCGSEDGSTFEDNACQTTFKGQCGKACQTDTD